MSGRESIIRNALAGIKPTNNTQHINVTSKIGIVVNIKEESIYKTDDVVNLLTNLLCAAKNDALNNRDNTYRVCHSIAKQYELYCEMRLLMKTKWQVESMRQLTDEQLRCLYHFMRALEAWKVQSD